MKGRKPTPTAIRLLQGNPQKRPINRREPRPRRLRPACPDWLSDEAKLHWEVIVPELERTGLLTAVDGGALAGMCQQWARFREATEFLKERGSFYKTDSGYLAQFPQVGIARQCLDSYVRIATEFGLTPASRTRISTKSDEADDHRDLDAV